MKNILTCLNAEYGRYIDTLRAIPWLDDCLKPVERRILLVVYEEAATKLTKCAKVIGAAIGKYHGHGDCFPADTLVYGLNNEIYKIGDLADQNIEELDVLGFDIKTNEIVPVKAKYFRKAKTVTKLYRISLSDGGEITCTDNHPILTENNEFIEARNIKKYDIIESCKISKYKHTDKNVNQYLTITNHRQKTKPLHRLVFDAGNELKYDVIHHIDENYLNNLPSNLVSITRSEHALEHNDYLIGLEKGRNSMFSDNGKYREATRLKNESLIAELHKHGVILKAFKILTLIENDGLELTETNYNYYRKFKYYNGPFLEKLIRNKKISSFEDLLERRLNFKFDSEASKNFTGKYDKVDVASNSKFTEDAKINWLLDSGSFIIRHMIAYCADYNKAISYESMRKQIILKFGTGGNIADRQYPKLKTLIDKFETFENFTDSCSKNANIIFVTNVEILEYTQDIPVYDFTVDKYENMFIITKQCDNGDLHLCSVHNSSAYQTLIGMVNRGLVIGQGNFGAVGIHDMSAAAYRYCLTGDILVSCAEGNIQIRDLNNISEENRTNVLSLDGQTNTASQFFDSGIHPTIEIKTKHNSKLKGSYNHPIIILTPDLEFEWKNLEDLKVGDIAVRMLKNNICEKSKTENELILLGGLYSEGWSTKTNKIGFNNTNKSFFNIVYDAACLISNKIPKIQTSTLPSGLQLYSFELCSEATCDLIEQIGYVPNRSGDLVLPDEIMNLNSASHAIFLRYLFEGDGSIASNSRTDIITYISSSLKLSEQIKHILEISFGITCKLSKSKKEHPEYRLVISNRKHIRIFYDEIGFVGNSPKQHILEAIINKPQLKPFKPLIEKIPHIDKFVKNNTTFQYKSTYDRTLGGINFNFKDSLKQNIGLLSKYLPDELIYKLDKLYDNKYTFDEITEINKCDPENVYCIRVDSECHSFVTNGFISHNTECKANPSVVAMFKDYLKFVPWKQLEMEPEPLSLPSIIPIGLVGEGVIQGIGYNTVKTPRYAYGDLIKRLQSLLRDDEVKPLIIPNISNCTLYENEPGAFEKILHDGEGVIQIVPNTKIADDGKSLYVFARNPLTGFTKILNYCADYEKENGNPPFTILDITENNIFKVQILPLNKQKVTKDFELEILKLISIRLHTKCNFVTEDMIIKQFGIDYVLLNCYNKWKDCWLSKLKNDKSNLTHKLYELNIITIIRLIINTSPTIKKISEIVDIYVKNYKTTHGYDEKEITTICSKYTIKKLIEVDIDLVSIQNEINDIQTRINNHDTLVLAHVLAL